MIELRGVSKTVQSGDHPLTILHPLDYTIPSGQFVAIVGPSGSGKSTLLGLLAGLDAPSTGEILIDGVDITRLTEDGLARLRGEKIGFVFQFFHLVPSLTAFENILIPMEIAGRRDAVPRARQLLEEVGLTDRAHHYPSQLSGGEQQRIAIARALANDPPIVLADEPTGNLDSTTGRHIMDLLLNVRRARAVDAGAGDARRGAGVAGRHAAGAARRPSRDTGRRASQGGHGVGGGGAMTFVVRMALREIRASWQRLLFFFVCIAVGVASIVAIRSVIQSVREGSDARSARDDRRRRRRPQRSPDRREGAGGGRARSARAAASSLVSEAVEIATMVRPPNATTTRMVELRAVQPAFPLYGTMTLREGQYSHALLQGHGTLVRPELLAQLNLRVGDELLIGTQRFQIRGVIENEPGRNLGAFSLGSRLFIDFADLPSTGLLSFGSRASYELLLQVPRPPPVPGRRDVSDAARPRPGRCVRQRLRPRPVVPAERRPDEREPDARRELPEPRRPGRADSRRHRRLERDARVRPAEGAQHRDPQVRGQHDARRC